MSCDQKTDRLFSVSERFQSLSGFLMSCDDVRYTRGERARVFQSLSGFLMSCDGSDPVAPGRPGRRFNPYRVF